METFSHAELPNGMDPCAEDSELSVSVSRTFIAAIVRITVGNFHLVDRLLTQIERVQSVNDLDELTPEVVEAARQAVLIGL